jgi:hypothetical protein
MQFFSYSLACNFGCGEFYEGGLCVLPLPVKWSAIAEILRNSGVSEDHCC